MVLKGSLKAVSSPPVRGCRVPKSTDLLERYIRPKFKGYVRGYAMIYYLPKKKWYSTFILPCTQVYNFHLNHDVTLKRIYFLCWIAIFQLVAKHRPMRSNSRIYLTRLVGPDHHVDLIFSPHNMSLNISMFTNNNFIYFTAEISTRKIVKTGTLGLGYICEYQGYM